MNQYGLWTPRGTSNSEYGKFVFQNNFGPVRENFQKGSGDQWEGGDYYHEGQGDVGQYRVEYGEEAAAAALGGKDKLQAHLANAFQTQPQTIRGDEQPTGSVLVSEPEVVQEKQPEVCNVPVVEQEQQAAEPENIPTKKPSVPKPVKWRGLPPAIKYERQMRPLLSQMKALSVLPPTNMNFSTMGNKGSRIPPNFFQQQEESQTTAKSKPKTAFPTKQKFVSPKPELCGRCPKCKSIVPESNGPLVMTFPNNSAGLAKPNVRRMHSRGRQDAKNFRAVQHPHH